MRKEVVWRIGETEKKTGMKELGEGKGKREDESGRGGRADWSVFVSGGKDKVEKEGGRK